jgi:hypothetical protein
MEESDDNKINKYKSYSNELVNIKAQISCINDCFLEKFYSSHIYWYRKHAQRYKHLFKALTFIVLFLSMTITAASGLALISEQELNIYILITSSFVTFIQQIINTFFLQEKYKRYRATVEALRDAMNEYLSCMSDNDVIDKNQVRRQLIDNIRAITNSEVNEWKCEVKKDKKQANSEPDASDDSR